MEERTEVAITTFYKMVPRFFVLEIDLALDGMVMRTCSKLQYSCNAAAS